jgi:uncharacterized membrane protein (DUF485 family)
MVFSEEKRMIIGAGIGLVSFGPVSSKRRLVWRQSMVRAGLHSTAQQQTQQETSMNDDLVQRIAAHPAYIQLKAKRTSFGLWLTLAMMVVYYGFILLVAFNKPFLATRLGAGVMTYAMPIGFGVILFTIVITAIYVRRANSEYDSLAEQISKAVLK